MSMVMQPAGARLINYPPPAPGTGQLAKTMEAVENYDVVHGFDQTLGRSEEIPLGGRMAIYDKFKGVMNAGQAAGRLSGKVYA